MSKTTPWSGDERYLVRAEKQLFVKVTNTYLFLLNKKGKEGELYYPRQLADFVLLKKQIV